MMTMVLDDRRPNGDEDKARHSSTEIGPKLALNSARRSTRDSLARRDSVHSTTGVRPSLPDRCIRVAIDPRKYLTVTGVDGVQELDGGHGDLRSETKCTGGIGPRRSEEARRGGYSAPKHNSDGLPRRGFRSVVAVPRRDFAAS